MQELVTILIPTHNRCEQLANLLNRLLNQTYKNISIVISDNNSDDNTKEVCENFQDQSIQFKYIKQNIDLGSTGNFVYLYNTCETKYFMWLADDDYIDDNYIEDCMKMHQKEEYALVSGQPVYYDSNGEKVFEGESFSILDHDNCKRTCNLLKLNRDNGIFYGVYNKTLVNSLSALTEPRSWGVDILFIAFVAYQGKIGSIETACVHRSLDGVSATLENIVKSQSLNKINIFFPQLIMLYDVYSSYIKYISNKKINAMRAAYAYLIGSEKNWFLWMIYHFFKMLLKNTSPKLFNLMRSSIKKV
ncbi:MAG: glycosyltransferase [Gammaproteobacteria bacterium]|nr:glycosyltransferase [Gammaproteobacteria bacterium]